MTQFQTLIMSRDSPLNTKFLILIDATASMQELTNGLVENISCTTKTQKTSSVDNVCLFFEDNYIFEDNFNTSSWL